MTSYQCQRENKNMLCRLYSEILKKKKNIKIKPILQVFLKTSYMTLEGTHIYYATARGHHVFTFQLFRKSLREACNAWGKPSAAGN